MICANDGIFFSHKKQWCASSCYCVTEVWIRDAMWKEPIPVFDPCVWKMLWRRKWQPTPVFLPGKSHGQRSLEGFTPWGCKRVGHDLATEQQISLVSYIIFIELFHLSVLLYKNWIRKSSLRIATTPKVIVKIKWINAYKVFRMGSGIY